MACRINCRSKRGFLQPSMRTHLARLLTCLFIALQGGCAETAAGTVPPASYPLLPFTTPGGVDPSVARAIEHAVFFHPECPSSEVQVTRVSADRRFAELRVCGTVRQYQDIAPVVWNTGAALAPTWIEITSATSS